MKLIGSDLYKGGEIMTISVYWELLAQILNDKNRNK